MKFFLAAFLLILSAEMYCQQTKQSAVYFDFNKYDITGAAMQKLDSIIQLKSSVEKISLFGHCDAIGNDAYNDALSIKRVEAVKKYLLLKGLLPEVFENEKGFGKRQPINSNSGEEERLFNRRVDISYTLKSKPMLIEKPIVIEKPIPIEKPVEDIPIVKKEKSLKEIITDSATKKGTKIILKNINFFGGRHILLPQSVPTLLELLAVLKENPKLEIEIQGHICCAPGSEDGLDLDTDTYDLSVTRAKAIHDYLVEQGISTKRLRYKGFGHQHPLVYPEDTEEKKTTNRRVELKIIRK